MTPYVVLSGDFRMRMLYLQLILYEIRAFKQNHNILNWTGLNPTENIWNNLIHEVYKNEKDYSI